MKEKQDYIRDITEIRSMMERSSKFLSLSGWSGALAGIYALCGAFVAYFVFDFHPLSVAGSADVSMLNVLLLASCILILAVGTAIALSAKNANKRGEKVWNTTSRRMIGSMAVPLVTGGSLALIVIMQNLVGLVAPLTLIFYGIALYNAAKFTYNDVQYLGLIQIVLGLLASCFIPFSMLFWAVGFGVLHIIYGVHIHIKYKQ